MKCSICEKEKEIFATVSYHLEFSSNANLLSPSHDYFCKECWDGIKEQKERSQRTEAKVCKRRKTYLLRKESNTK